MRFAGPKGTQMAAPIFGRLQAIALLLPVLTTTWHDADEVHAQQPSRLAVPDKLVVMTFDDATRSHLEVAAPLLKSRGFGATFFVTGAWMDDREHFLSWDEMAKLHRMGFEIGNHSMHHIALHDPEPLEMLDREVRELEAGLARVGIPKPVSFSWPGNHFGPRSAQRLRELGYRFGRRGTVPDVPTGVPVVGMGPVYEPCRHDPMLIPSSGLAVPDWTLDDFKQVVAPAERGKVIVLQFHGTPDDVHPSCSTAADRFGQFLDYLKEQKFTVIAMRDLDRYFDLSQPRQDVLSREVHFFK